MDDIVKQAMSKWPDVPYCYGWLALDGRGAWRMRNERVQQTGLLGDKIQNPAMRAFIARNYAYDTRGCWFFQNGPQRVYVNLLSTPYIAHTDPGQGFVLHTGEPISLLDSAWITEEGQLILVANEKVAQVDDRDMAEFLTLFRMNGEPVGDERLLDWLVDPNDQGRLTIVTASRRVPVQRIASKDIATHFGFIRDPQPATA
jgi:hypothetical protein